jgi:hypothetical protein
MIKQTTWIFLGVLVLALVAYFVITRQTSETSSQSTPTGLGENFLVTSADGKLQSLRIYDQYNRKVQIQRETNGIWIVTQPIPEAADQSLAGAAETQVGALRIVTILQSQLNLVDAGLDSPAYTIELTFDSGKKHVIQVGTLTPTNSGYYVSYDAKNLYIISQAGIDALLNLLAAPPFVATEASIPTIEATSTSIGEVAKTPTP